MRIASVAQMKGQGSRPCLDAPTEGTSLRRVYDLLLTHRGNWTVPPVDIDRTVLANIKRQLIDFHGFDIEQRRLPGLIRKEWRLKGEWIGRDYLLYLEGSE